MPPPRKSTPEKQKSFLVKSRLSTLLALALIGLSGQASADIAWGTDVSLSGPDENGWLHIIGDGSSNDGYALITVNGEGAETEWRIDAPLRIDQHPVICQSQFSITAIDSGTITIAGDLDFDVTADSIHKKWDEGTYALYGKNHGTLNLIGKNISVEIRHNLPDDQQLSSIGANAVYVRDESHAVIGQEGGTARIWVLAAQPDLISAKKGSSVTFKSTNNQLVGSIDMMDDPNNAGSGTDSRNSIQIRFSGSDSYWFGDEKTWQNSTMRDGAIAFDAGDNFDINLEDGAQWSYLSLPYVRHNDYWSIPKRISKVTLNGGIINLFDQNLQDTWKEIGLWDALNDGDFSYGMDTEYKHDYVVVGDLQGSGGIFRMDLNAEDKTASDMLYIEAGGEAGGTKSTHYFEPYRLDLLKPITPENTLTFALVKSGANIGFTDKENLDGDGLWNYELHIASKEITAEDIEANRDYWERSTTLEHKINKKTEEFTFTVNPDDYLGGQNWYIYRVTLHESEALQGMSGAGWASYGAAVEMDRRDRRLAETVRNAEDPENGLWIRAHHGRSGVSNQYRWDRTGITLGFERDLSANNTLGAWFGYTEGDTDLLDVDGKGEMKRYELALYDTYTFRANYVDLVARLGKVSSEFNAANATYGTSGDFDQNYAALSAEYGYKLTDANTGVFIEPQVHFQAAYLDSYDYRVQRNIRVEADSNISVIGRVGLRAGKQFRSDNHIGELYFRGDVLHQFTDGQDADFRASQDMLQKTWGDLDTWCDFGVGGYFTWKNTLNMQLDLERTTGGDIDNTWQILGRLSYLF